VTEKIFKAIDRRFIKELFENKKKLFFPLNKGNILNIEIKKISPDWAKKSCLVKYKISFDDKSQKIVRGTAKAGRTKKPVWQIMKYLYSNNFCKGGLRIPKALDFIPNANLLLYEEAPGITFTEVIERGDKKAEKSLKDIAKWLAKLHGMDYKNRRFCKAVFLGSAGYRNIFRKIVELLPELKKDLIPISRLDFIDQIWRRGKETLIHNDFYPGNAILDNEIIFGIDFDRAGFGPFLMDIATFYGALEFPKEIWNLKLPEKQIRRLQDILLKNYCKIRKLNYTKTKKDLRKLLVKVFLDQIHYYGSFMAKGWNSMNEKTKDDFALKIKALLLKTKQCLKNL
jgi:thiamine kinase-like enzyme